MSGWLTKQRYNYATVVVDHHSRSGFIHPQKTQSIGDSQREDPLQTEDGLSWTHSGTLPSQQWSVLRFEMEGGLHRGRPGGTPTPESMPTSNPELLSGAPENYRTMQGRCQSMHTPGGPRQSAHLWLYALRPACDVFNEAPTKKLKCSPLEPASSFTVMPEPKHWKPFGCPVYVLDSALQNSGGIKHK